MKNVYVAVIDANKNQWWVKKPRYEDRSCVITFTELSPAVILPIEDGTVLIPVYRQRAEDILDRLLVPWEKSSIKAERCFITGGEQVSFVTCPFELAGPLIGDVAANLTGTFVKHVTGKHIVKYGGF